MHNNRDLEGAERREIRQEKDVEQANTLVRPIIRFMLERDLPQTVTAFNYFLTLLPLHFPTIRILAWNKLEEAYARLEDDDQNADFLFEIDKAIDTNFGDYARDTAEAQARYSISHYEPPEYYAELIKLDPYDKMFPVNLAKAYENEERYDDALQVFMNRIEPENGIYAQDPRAYAQALSLAKHLGSGLVIRQLDDLVRERGVYVRQLGFEHPRYNHG